MKKNIFKSLFAVSFAASFLLNGTVLASDIDVKLDGESMSFDVPPQILHDRTMVPMRAIFETLGAEVNWDETTHTATGTRGDTTVSITVGDNKLIKNNQTITLDVPAEIIDQRTLVPVRAVSEAFDCYVQWDGNSKTVTISTSGAFPEFGIPAYSGEAYAVINGNKPYFTKNDYTTVSFETYSDLDYLGRCYTAYANVGTDIMPTEKRGSISSVKPTGWQSVKYDFVDGKYLYNRCHLIGYQLTGENANKKNLITGTRYMNVDGMLPFENMTADYVKETNNHVLYRVTPVFRDDNLVAEGVLMEAESVEDSGDGVEFNVYCYNVQPGVIIDYSTGKSYAKGGNSAASAAGDFR